MPLIMPNTIANETPADGDKLDQNFDTITDWANQNAITSDGLTAMVAPLLLPGAPTQPNQAATKDYVDATTGTATRRYGTGLVGAATAQGYGENVSYLTYTEAWDSDGFYTSGKTIIVPVGLGGMYLIGVEVTALGGAVNGNTLIHMAAKGIMHDSVMMAGLARSIPLIVVTDLQPAHGIEVSTTNGHSSGMSFQCSLVVQRLSP